MTRYRRTIAVGLVLLVVESWSRHRRDAGGVMRELFGSAAFTVTFVVLLAANVVGVLLLTSVVSVPAWLVIAGWLALWTALGWVVARARGSRPTDWASVCALPRAGRVGVAGSAPRGAHGAHCGPLNPVLRSADQAPDRRTKVECCRS